eukprot:179539_1
MATAEGSKLHWCTEKIPTGSKYFLEFEQSLTEPQFLSSLQREGSWIGDAPLITDSFDISRLQYLVPTLRYADITSTDPKQIEEQLLRYSQYLLQPLHAFVHLFTNFDLCAETEYIPLNNISNCNQYTNSLPLFTGNIINKSLIDGIRTLMQRDQLKSLRICQDVARTGRGLRCLYPQQYNALQHRFVVRATVDYKYPGEYTLQHDGMEVLLMDHEWTAHVNKIQNRQIHQQPPSKLWKPLFIDQSTSASSNEEEDPPSTNIRSVSDRSARKKKYKYRSPFILYDLCQNRYSSHDKNLNNIVSALSESSREALKCANMQRAFDKKIGKAQVYMILSIKEHETAPTAYVYRLNILRTTDVNRQVKALSESKEEDESVGQLLVNDIIRTNIDEYHGEILQSEYCTADTFIEITNKILEFLKLKQTERERNNLLLLQERAIIILADVIWMFYKRFYKELVQWLDSKDMNAIVREFVSVKEENIKQLCDEMELLKGRPPPSVSDSNDLAAYYGFLEPFLKASNEKELQDFNECAQILLAQHRGIVSKTEIKYCDINVSYSTSSGMRVGISSANASDNWTNSKLNGGVTINMAINLDSLPRATPVTAQVHCIASNVCIRLSTTHTMSGNVRQDTIEFTKDNMAQFLVMDDNRDVFRMLKYSLIFVGIVVDPKDNQSDDDYASILSDIARFTGGHGLSLSVSNLGPSRSGFASSSAVACNILKVLYACCGCDIAHNDELLASMALLLENRLGLKSGRQDVDGLFAAPNGVKVLHYNETTQFVTPKISFLRSDRFNIDELCRKMILVNSGIARASGLGLHRGLNMRFLAYLSRDPVRFKSILQSYRIHSDIVDALQSNNYCFLGKLFVDYMSCRERIDPGATQSKYDAAADGEKVLRRLFDPLMERDLIYGGMFTGAMGGGVAMLSLTPNANETNIECALDELKQWKTKNEDQPFARLQRIEYSVNCNGILLSTSRVGCDKLLKKEYLFESMDDETCVCLDLDEFAQIVFPIDAKVAKEIKQVTDKAAINQLDVHIVVSQTHYKNGNIQSKVVSAKTV